MLNRLLSSKPKVNLVNLFLAYPGRSFSYTELRMTIAISPILLKATLKELVKTDFVLVYEKHKKRYYQINKHFALYPELVSMLRKIKHIPPDLLAKAAAKTGDCKFVALSGVFVGRPRLVADVLFVGKIPPKRLQKFLKLAEKFSEQEISYTILSQQEFEYRKMMNDRFVKDILENEPVVVLDKLKHRNIAKLVYKL